MRAWRSVWQRLAFVVVCLVVPVSAGAQAPLGIIMVHGKQGTAIGNQGMAIIASNLQSAGHKVIQPTLPWGRGSWETIDITAEGALDLLDGYANRLRGQGAGRIVMIGHSLGAAVGLAHAVERGPLGGLVMLAPGHSPAALYQSNDRIRRDVDRARLLVEQGKGNEVIAGGDANQGNLLAMTVRAAVYYSWQNPNGLASMPSEAPRLPATTPLLMVVGDKDRIALYARGQLYQPAARNPYSQYVTNGANHIDTPMAAAKVVTDWVNGLPR
jgi:pimeloyl-ACP methyl ester carboxylesterase